MSDLPLDRIKRNVDDQVKAGGDISAARAAVAYFFASYDRLNSYEKAWEAFNRRMTRIGHRAISNNMLKEHESADGYFKAAPMFHKAFNEEANITLREYDPEESVIWLLQKGDD